jgi:hypothetical protein
VVIVPPDFEEIDVIEVIFTVDKVIIPFCVVKLTSLPYTVPTLFVA